MSRRNYGQHCGAAAALDAIGDRWTLLIVRDLLLGPLRYTDLLNSLKGIGTDALADRLRRLEQLGAVTKKAHDPPYVSITYQLTERGELLGPAVKALAEFGMALLDDPIECTIVCPLCFESYTAGRWIPRLVDYHMLKA